MSWFALCLLPGLGRKVDFKLGLRKARHLRSRRLAVKFCLARQITNYAVLQELQSNWSGPAVEVTGSPAPFNNALGLFPSRNTWTLSKSVTECCLSLFSLAQEDKQAHLEGSSRFFLPCSPRARELSCVLSLQSRQAWASGVKRVQDHTESDATLDG